MRFRPLLLALVSAACSAAPPEGDLQPVPSAPAEDRAEAPRSPATPATRRAPVAAEAPQEERAGPTSPEREVVVHVAPVLHRVSAPGEDGSGTLVQSTRSVAVDLVADGWPGRAGDPVLQVGGHRFVHYEHVSPTTLRFVAAEPALLPPGAEARVLVGDEELARFELPRVVEP